MKVLVVEDEEKLGRFLHANLLEHAHIVKWVTTCAEANDALAETGYEIIILDLGLPDGDGLDLIREWRASGFTEPVLILSARNTRADRIAGLDLGADDYLPKPFGIDELLARMRALIRRQAVRKETLFEHNGITLDLLGNVVRINDTIVELSAREFALMAIFVQNAGRVLTRSLISEKIWESHFDVEANLLDVYMSRLRAKIGLHTDRTVFKTVRGIGYQLI
ncbi:MAG: response regulator transcription factor [Novosphingobium sp.]